MFTYPIPSGYSPLGGIWDTASLPADVALDATNLIITKTSSNSTWSPVRNLTKLAGKQYLEIKAPTAGAAGMVTGFAPSSLTYGQFPGNIAGSSGHAWSATGPNFYVNNSVTETAFQLSGVTVFIGMAIDWPNQYYWVRNSTGWFGLGGTAGDPVAETNPVLIGQSGSATSYFMAALYEIQTVTAKFSGGGAAFLPCGMI